MENLCCETTKAKYFVILIIHNRIGRLQAPFFDFYLCNFVRFLTKAFIVNRK